MSDVYRPGAVDRGEVLTKLSRFARIGVSICNWCARPRNEVGCFLYPMLLRLGIRQLIKAVNT